eukprot:3435365-Pyramimonas_sp.AAC.1
MGDFVYAVPSRVYTVAPAVPKQSRIANQRIKVKRTAIRVVPRISLGYSQALQYIAFVDSREALRERFEGGSHSAPLHLRGCAALPPTM